MAILVGNSTANTATGYSHQRKLLRTSNGTLVLFAYLGVGVGIKYKTSTDNGENWSAWITAYSTTNPGPGFSVYIDTNNDILLVFNSPSTSPTDVKFRKLTYSAGTWTNGIVYAVGNPGWATQTAVTITRRSNNEIWVCVNRAGNIYFYYSTDEGQTWTDKSITGFGYAINNASIIPFGSNIKVIYQTNGTIVENTYISSWGSPSTVASSGITNILDACAVLRVNDSEIYVAGRTASGIKVYRYTGTWDSGTLVTDNTNDGSPCFSQVGSKIVFIWRDYDGSNYNIYVKEYSGSWGGERVITNDVAADSYPSALGYDTTDLYFMWLTGSASPYSIYFKSFRYISSSISSIGEVYEHKPEAISSISGAYVKGLIDTTILGWRTVSPPKFCPDLINFSFIFPVIYISEENPKLSIGNSKLPVLVSGCLYGYSIYLENTGTSGNTEIDIYVNSTLKSNITIPANGGEYKKNIYFPMDFLLYPEDYIEVQVISFAVGAENLRVNVNEMSFSHKIEKLFIGNYSDSVIFQGLNREYIFTSADYWYLDFNQAVDSVNYLIGVDNNGEEINLSYAIENGLFYKNRIKITKYSISLLEKIKIKIKDILGEYHILEIPIIVRSNYSNLPDYFYGNILSANTFIPATDYKYSFDGGSSWSSWESIVSGKINIDFTEQVEGIKNIKIKYKKNFEVIEEDKELIYTDTEIDCEVYFKGKTAQVAYTDIIPLQRVEVYSNERLSGIFFPTVKVGMDSLEYDSEAETITINSGSLYYGGQKYDFAGQIYTVDKGVFSNDLVLNKQVIFGFNKSTKQFVFLEVPDDTSNELPKNYSQIIILSRVFYKVHVKGLPDNTWELSVFFDHSSIEELPVEIKIELDKTKTIKIKVIDTIGRERDFTQDFIQTVFNVWKTLTVKNGTTEIKPGQIHNFITLTYTVDTEEI